MCVSAQAFSERKRSSGYFKSLLKHKKTPEDPRFGKKSSTREDVSFVICSDVSDLCVSAEAFLDRKRVGSLELVRLDFWFTSK